MSGFIAVEPPPLPSDPNDGDLNITGNGSFGSLNITGNGSFGSLNVSGVGSFGSLNVSGVGSFGSLNVSGVITASSFVGNGSSITGIKLPQNLQTSAYVLASTDAGKHVAISTGGVTLNSSIFTTGDTVTVYNDSNYTQMINVGSGVTMRRVSIGDTGSRGLNSYGLATILCISNNSYVISGAGLT